MVITHANVLSNIEPLETEIRKYLKYERFVHPVRFLNLLPLSHVFGQFLGMFLPQLMAGTVVFQETLSPSEVIRTIHNQRVSVLVAVPRMLQSLKEKIERDLEESGQQEWFHHTYREAQGKHFLRRWWMFRRIRREFGWKFWAFIHGGAALDSVTAPTIDRSCPIPGSPLEFGLMVTSIGSTAATLWIDMLTPRVRDDDAERQVGPRFRSHRDAPTSSSQFAHASAPPVRTAPNKAQSRPAFALVAVCQLPFADPSPSRPRTR